MKRGLFISFEGNDGSGKSTVCCKTIDFLRKKGYNIVETREPGGSPVSEKIRELLLDPANKDMDPVTEAYLYASSRAEYLRKTVAPAVMDGKTVVTDRYIDSSLAYQGVGRGLGMDTVATINDVAISNIVPDITFLISVDPEIGMERIVSRETKDRLEQEDIEFHKRAYEGFLKLAEIFPDRIQLIDGTQEPEKVFADVREKLEELLDLWDKIEEDEEEDEEENEN